MVDSSDGGRSRRLSARAALLVRGASSALFLRAAGQLGMFCAAVVLARAGGARHYGIYAYSLAWLNVLMLVARAGTDTLVVRFVPTYAAHGRWPDLRGLLRWSGRATSGAALLVAAAGGIAAAVFYGGKDPAVLASLLLAMATVPAWAWLSLHSAILRGFKRIFASLLADNVVKPLVLVLAGGLLWLVERGQAAPALLQAAFLAAVIVALAVAWYVRRVVVAASVPLVPASLAESPLWLRTAPPLMLLSGGYLLIGQTDVIMIGLLLEPEMTAAYAVASRVASTIGLGLVAVNAVFAPVIAERYARGDMTGLQANAVVAARVNLLITGVLLAGVLLAGRALLSVFGEEYVAGLTILRVLCLGELVNAWFGSVGFLMTMTGHQRQAVAIMTAAAAANILLNALWIPLFGPLGAAWASVTTVLAWNVVMWAFVRWRLGVETTILARMPMHGTS